MKIIAINPNIINKALCLIKKQESKTYEQMNNLSTYPAYYNNISFGSGGYNFFLKNVQGMTCAYTGKKVINPKETTNFVNKADDLRGENLVKCIQKYSKELDPSMNKQAADMICDLAIKNSKQSLNAILETMINKSKNSEIIIESKNQLFCDMEKLSDENYMELKPFINTLNKRKIKETTQNLINKNVYPKDKENLEKLRTDALNVRSQYNDINVFILRNANSKNPKSFLRKILEPMTSSIEHIKPHCTGKSQDLDIAGNYLITTAKINSLRGNTPLAEWVKNNPEIKIEENMQKYIDNVSEILNSPQMQKDIVATKTGNKDRKALLEKLLSYPQDVAAQIEKQSDGLIKLKYQNPNRFIKIHKGQIVKNYKR